MSDPRESTYRTQQYGIALGLCLAALIFSLLVEAITAAEPLPLVLLTAIALTSLLTGLGPALLAIVIATVLLIARDILAGNTPLRFGTALAPALTAFFGLTIALLAARLKAVWMPTGGPRTATDLWDDAVFEQAAVGMAQLDISGRWLHVNNKLCEIVGFEKHELLEKTFQQITYPEDLPPDLSYMRQLLAGSITTYSLEKRYVHRDGHLVWANLTASLVRHTDGRPHYFISVIENIQRRKQVEADLRESQNRLQVLIDYAPAGLAMFDQKMRYLALSQRWRDDYGLVGRQVLGHCHYDLFPDLRDDWKDAHRRILRGEVVIHNEEKLVRGDGSVQFIRWMGRPWYGSDKSIGGLVIFVEDITAQRLADAKLRIWGTSSEQAHFGLAIMEANRIGLMDVNRAFAQMLGYERGELIGAPPDTVIPPESRNAITLGMDQADATGHYVFEADLMARDGRRFPTLIDMTSIRSPDGEISHRIAYVLDITERKNAENAIKTALEEARNANLANIAKSEFLANMSHEIRTPISAMLGATEMLRRYDLHDHETALLDTQEAAGKHLLNVINDILDLSRIEAGKLELVETAVDIRQIIENVIAMLKDQIEEKSLEVLVEMADPLPAPLVGDAGRIQQALLNYVSNAVKFTDEGCIDINIQNLDEHQGNALIYFGVHDTGIGISDAQLAKLFTPFSQGDGTAIRKQGGTGLGLAITARLAQLMGGNVGVHSTVGKGSTFWFSARLRKGDVVPQAAELDEETAEEVIRRDFAGQHVLIVEDNPVLQQLTAMSLKRTGLIADVANDGIEALEKAGREHYSAIIMDVQMPRMGGLEAVRRLRELPAYARVPIIALTANVFEQDRHASIEAGFDDFLSKPIKQKVLLQTMLKWLSEKR